MRYTKHNLEKIEQIIRESSYTIRNERGNFKAGYCILESRKVVVVNKFFSLESRMNSLMEILHQILIDPATLSDGSRSLYEKLVQPSELKPDETEAG